MELSTCSWSALGLPTVVVLALVTALVVDWISWLRQPTKSHD